MKQCSIIIICYMLLFTLAATEEPFQEQFGVVVMQMESIPLTGAWEKETAVKGYTGTSYYTWRAGGANTISAAGQGVLTYPMNISTTGTYAFRFHTYHNSPDGDQTHQNDTWVRVRGKIPWTKTLQSGGYALSWNWHTRMETEGWF